MRRSWKVRLRTGSLSVEASVLMPFLTLLVFVFLCLGMYLHDRSVLAASAAELAGKGAARKYQTEEALENWLQGQAAGLVKERLLTVQDMKVYVDVTTQKVTVRYQAKTPLLGGMELFEEAFAKRVNPVMFLRISRQLGSAIQE